MAPFVVPASAGIGPGYRIGTEQAKKILLNESTPGIAIERIHLVSEGTVTSSSGKLDPDENGIIQVGSLIQGDIQCLLVIDLSMDNEAIGSEIYQLSCERWAPLDEQGERISKWRGIELRLVAWCSQRRDGSAQLRDLSASAGAQLSIGDAKRLLDAFRQRSFRWWAIPGFRFPPWIGLGPCIAGRHKLEWKR
ncbi:hypothetical protein K227x_57010 [Rubripirellula lacrimiformis]|uniref:Uncharacterized protein n=1 Tax=Rubripirellula lacrimiformis TaxID=1930273 RepID=A0A517NJG4_9BACT|nr:hypothetical protein K227x_57010 [Rubripirellula lacrimiformis]